MRIQRPLAALVLAVLVAAACGSSDDEQTTTEAPVSEAPVDTSAPDATSSAAATPPADPEATETPDTMPVTEPVVTEPVTTDTPAVEPVVTEAPPEAEVEPGRLEFTLVGCQQSAIIVPVEPEAAAALVPADEELYLDEDGMANYYQVAKTCTDIVVDGASVGGGHFDTQWVRVAGPEEQREYPDHPDLFVLPTDYFVPVGFVTDNEAYRDAVTEFGVPMALAESMEMDPIGPGEWTGSVAAEEAYSWTVDNVTEAGMGVFFVHLLERADGDGIFAYEVECPATLVWTDGPTVVRPAPDSMAHEAFGPELAGVGYAVDLTCDVTIERTFDVAATEGVAYTDSKELDIYAPAVGSDWPVAVYFHGGPPLAESAARREATGAPQLAARGMVVYVPQWASLGPDGGSQDTICALAFAEETATEYGGDPERMTITGYSTGGYDAAIHALIADEPPLESTDCLVDPAPGLPDAAVPGGTPFFVVDAARAGAFDNNPQWAELTPAELDAFDPYLALGRNPDARLVLVVGEEDVGGGNLGEIPIAASNLEYYEALIAAGYDAELVLLPGGHDLEPGTEKFDQWVQAIVETARATE